MTIRDVWPLAAPGPPRQMAMPGGRLDGTLLRLWYGDEASPVVRLGSIDLAVEADLTPSAVLRGMRGGRLHSRRTGDMWDPRGYLRFGDERTRPSVDLASRIALSQPATVADLGCGPGNSSNVLRQRWPRARVTGVDSSPHMIATAAAQHPEGHWLLADIEEWCPETPFDVVFSNAALQWLPDHGPLVERLFGHVAAGGALGFQVPSADYALVRTLIHEVALEGPWASRMAKPLGALTMESPCFYYGRLAPIARSMDIWETEYAHVMDSAGAIVDWMASTELRPFLAVIESDTESGQFVGRLRERVRESYPTRRDGRVLFAFKRTFVIAYA